MMRPTEYHYLKTLYDHLGGDLSRVFSGRLVYPRQLEIHLPGDRKRACNFRCLHCLAKLLEKPLVPFEEDALKMVEKLAGKIPYLIYGGAYTEPLLSPYLLDFIKVTKKHGAHFGLHTNGSLLTRPFLSELCGLATSRQDYLSVSLDAGTPESHMLIKNIETNCFDEIIESLKLAVALRRDSDGPAIRVSYLLDGLNASEEELRGIVEIMQEIKVDSLRFSIPYDFLSRDFDQVRQYKRAIEIERNLVYAGRLKPLMSKDRPRVFYLSPEHQDVDRMNFGQCIYGYYEIVLAADGYVYRCSNVASPTFSMLRLGKVTDDLETMLLANQDPHFDPSICFAAGARCTRAALEINSTWRRYYEKNKTGQRVARRVV